MHCCSLVSAEKLSHPPHQSILRFVLASHIMPIKPLSFTGDKKTSKKRKHPSSSAHDSSANTADQVTSEDSWTLPSQASDLNGPVLIVLPPLPPPASDYPEDTTSSQPKPSYALATDPTGSIYASPLHNLIESDPTTAEPDSIQQVWQCHRIPNTTSSSSTSTNRKDKERVEMSLKASHGAYLAADSGASGALSARREARSVEESWIVEEVDTSDLADGGDSAEHDGRSMTTKIPDSKRRFRLRTSASLAASTPAAVDPRLPLHTANTHPLTDANADTTKSKKEEEGKYLIITYSSSATKAPTLHTSSTYPSDPNTHLILRMQTRFKTSISTSSTTGQGNNSSSTSKMSRRELNAAVGRDLNDDEVRRLKKARKDGNFYEEVLDVRVEGKHDKFA